MALVTRAEFAKLAGVTRQNIYTLVAQGALVIRPDGKMETEQPTNAYYLTEHQNRNKAGQSKNQNGTVKSDLKKKPSVKKEKKKILIDPVEPGIISNDKYELQCEKLRVDIKRGEIDAMTKRGELVSRETIALVFARLHAIDSREFLQIPANVSPDIAAACGLDDPKKQIEIEKMIKDKIYATLQRSKNLLIEKLRDMKTELPENEFY